MRNIVLVVWCALMGRVSLGAQELSPDFLRVKSVEARALLSRETVKYYSFGKGKKIQPYAREIALAAYSLKRDLTEVIRLEVAISKKKNSSFVFSVKTPGYRVERIAGKGITRLVFDVASLDGETLTILDSRHLHLEKKVFPRDLFYFPYSDVFARKSFVVEGADDLFRLIQEAKIELCVTNAMSRAYPEKRLCDVAPDMWLAVLGIIEQTDNGEFFANRCGDINCSERAVQKALVHIARNDEHAFYYSISVDGARGFMQFMNSRRIPTYRIVRDRYLEVGLEKDFEKGTADMKNSIKAALCLLDFNLAELPAGIRKQFLSDPKIGGIYAAAAHNGGAGRARKLYNVVQKQKSFDWENFKAPRRTVFKETEGFIKKYLQTWDILADIRK